MGVLSSIFGNSLGQQGTLLNYIISWGFWSKETGSDYYASLEDGSPYYSITEKQ